MFFPLMKTPYMFPTAAYSFIKDRPVALKLTVAVQPLLTYIRGYLIDAALGIESLGALKL